MQKRIRLKHDRLAEELNRGRLSQNAWALHLGLSKSYLSELVNGKRKHPSRSTREKLLRGLHLDFEDLFEIDWDETCNDRLLPSGRVGDWTVARFRLRLDRLPPLENPGEHMFENLGYDLRHGLRILLRNPLFCLVALSTLALGIAVNIAAFSVVNGILLKALPGHQPDELVVLDRDRFYSNRDLFEIAAGTRAFSDIAGMSPGWTMALIESGNSVQVLGARVSSNFFSTLGVPPALGRGFTAEESIPGQDLVAIISHRLWQDRYGGEPGMLGRIIDVDGEKRRVVGILPAGFEVLQPGTDVWLTLPRNATAWYHTGGTNWLLARLASGATLEQAQQDFEGLLEGIREKFSLPEDYARNARITDLREAQISGFKPLLWALLLASLMVLAITVLNLTHFILTRLSSRRREWALRQALGASRGRLNRQLLAEAGLLAILGAGLGGVCSPLSIQLLLSLLPANLPRRAEIGLDFNVLLFGAFAGILVWMLLGMLPAAFVRHRNLLKSLVAESNATTAAGRRSWSRTALVVSEIMLAQALTIGAGLMIHSVWRLYEVDPGFSAGDLYTFSVQPSGEAYVSGAARRNYYAELRERLEALPGVESAGATQHLPLTGFSWTTPVEVEGRPPENLRDPGPRIGWRVVDTGFFRTLRIPLVEGREFETTDSLDRDAVVILNQAAARSILPGEDLLGKRIKAGNATNNEWATIVGVVGDIRHDSLAGEAGPALYVPYSQRSVVAMSFALRARNPGGLANSVRQAVWSLDDRVPISLESTYSQIIDESIAQPRFVSFLLGIFAALGLLLGAIGVYGLIALGVVQRTREFGIRMAVGAQPRQVLRMMLGQGLRMTLLGLAGGTLLGLLASRLLTGLLFEIEPHDPATYLAVSLVLGLASTLASYLPARGATRVDPVSTLRST